MAVVQITRIQNRRGTSKEIPDHLEDGEFGVTTDTGEVFVGAPNLPQLQNRRTYPYQNIKVLTEFDVQRSITGDVYYHGPLVAARCVSNGVDTSVLPLFTNGSREFATYDFSLKSNDGNIKLMGIMTVCVNTTTPEQSVVNLTPGAMCSMNWPGDIPTSASGEFKLSSLDSRGINTGVTWLSFRNHYGLELVLSISGREWTTPVV